ncbi:hypothetical protein L1887_30142 [Cichorium endivia]|nr:hypothetical protein L1887_30142 [Cichorium endivia]
MDWIWFRGSVFAKPEESWERWWYEEQDRLRTTGLLGIIFEIILDLRFFFFQYGIVYQLGIVAGSKSVAVYILSWIYVIVYACDKYTYLLSACTVSARTYDMIFGVIVLMPVAALSWLPRLQSMQTRILFNEAFSRGGVRVRVRTDTCRVCMRERSIGLMLG